MLGIFEQLELGPLERLASEFVPALVSSGLSKNAIYNSLVPSIPDISRPAVSALVDYSRSILNSQAAISQAGRNEIMNSSLFPPATSTLTRNYHVQVAVNVYDPELNTNKDIYVTIATDTYTTKDAFFNDYGDLITAYALGTSPTFEEDQYSVNSFEVSNVLRNPSAT